jgi:hypothetical protein
MSTQTRQLCFENKWVKGERDGATVQRNITHQFSEGMGQWHIDLARPHVWDDLKCQPLSLHLTLLFNHHYLSIFPFLSIL